MSPINSRQSSGCGPNLRPTLDFGANKRENIYILSRTRPSRSQFSELAPLRLRSISR